MIDQLTWENLRPITAIIFICLAINGPVFLLLYLTKSSLFNLYSNILGYALSGLMIIWGLISMNCKQFPLKGENDLLGTSAIICGGLFSIFGIIVGISFYLHNQKKKINS